MTTHSAQTQATVITLLNNIAPDADLNTLGHDEDIRQALGIDSFDFLNLMIGINDSFGIEIPEQDYGNLITLADIVAYIEARRP